MIARRSENRANPFAESIELSTDRSVEIRDSCPQDCKLAWTSATAASTQEWAHVQANVAVLKSSEADILDLEPDMVWEYIYIYTYIYIHI